MFLGRREPYQRFSALTMAMVTEPQYVCGADTQGLGLLREITPEHVARDRCRQDHYSGKKQNIRS
jgi:hypothetical protein